MPSYIPSPGVDTNNPQAVQRDQTAQLYRDQYLPLLVAGSAADPIPDKLNASIQLFYLAGALDAANALVSEAVAAANAIGAAPAVEIFNTAIQKVLDSLNPPPPPPEQQAIIAGSLLVQIGDKQAQLAACQAQCTQLAEEIVALTAQLGETMPQVGG